MKISKIHFKFHLLIKKKDSKKKKKEIDRKWFTLCLCCVFNFQFTSGAIILSFTICRFWVYNRPSKKKGSRPHLLYFGGAASQRLFYYLLLEKLDVTKVITFNTVTLISISWRWQTPSYPWERVIICKERIPRIGNNKVKKCLLLSFLKKSGKETFLFFFTWPSLTTW